jgi:hypothetical protein
MKRPDKLHTAILHDSDNDTWHIVIYNNGTIETFATEATRELAEQWASKAIKLKPWITGDYSKLPDMYDRQYN